MSGADWIARKLGGGAPQQGNPQQFVPMPAQQRSYPQQPGNMPPTHFNRPSIVTRDNLLEAVTMWDGDQGVRDAQRCPECNGPNFFSRTNKAGGLMLGGAKPPAPQCFDCGFPLVQFASHGGVGGLAERSNG